LSCVFQNPKNGDQKMADQTVTLTVNNMSCAHCSGMVQKTLEAIPGISGISVDLATKKARFWVREPPLVDQAVEAVTQAGYPAARD
jgi:Cu+-exporting ATPase